MRATLFGGLVSALVLGGFVATGACGGDDNLLNPLDAGGDSATDSTVPSDASADSNSSDANGGDDSSIVAPLTVTALDESGEPLVGAAVVFYALDGTPQPTLLTNANGMVSTPAEKGSAVSVSIFSVQADGPLYDVTSFTQIEPGDHLTAIGSRTPKNLSADNGSVTVAFPGAVTNATGYEYWDGCDARFNGGGDTALPVGSECLQNDGGTLQIFGEALSTTGLLLASTESTDAGYSDGGTISGLTWSAVTPTTVPVTGVPSGSPTELDLNAAYYAGNELFGVIDSSYPLSGTFTAPQIGTPTSALLTDAVLQTTLRYAPTSGSAFTQQITQAHFAAGLSANFGSMPPAVHDAVTHWDGAGTASISFTADGALTSLDGTTTVLHYQIPLTDGGSANGTWTIVSPPQNSVTPPMLTTELVPALPTIIALYTLQLTHGTQYGSYGVYRRAYPKIIGGAADILASAPYQVEITGLAP